MTSRTQFRALGLGADPVATMSNPGAVAYSARELNGFAVFRELQHASSSA